VCQDREMTVSGLMAELVDWSRMPIYVSLCQHQRSVPALAVVVAGPRRQELLGPNFAEQGRWPLLVAAIVAVVLAAGPRQRAR